MSARFGLRAIRQNLRFARRRPYATATESAPATNESAFSKFFNSPVGPKTVHFWAPIMKWGVVLAGASDFARPASQLSIPQNAALMATGIIWTRWCFIIKPRNLFLASVNFLLFCVGATQVGRAVSYQQSVKKDGVGNEIKNEAKAEKNVLEKVIEDPKSVKDAVVGGK